MGSFTDKPLFIENQDSESAGSDDAKSMQSYYEKAEMSCEWTILNY